MRLAYVVMFFCNNIYPHNYKYIIVSSKKFFASTVATKISGRRISIAQNAIYGQHVRSIKDKYIRTNSVCKSSYSYSKLKISREQLKKSQREDVSIDRKGSK